MIIIGDEFAKDVFPTFQAMRSQAHFLHKKQMYIQDYFNLSLHTQDRLSTGNKIPQSRMLNALTSYLNENTLLPRYIIMMTDMDMIGPMELNDWGLSSCIRECLQWMTRNITKITDRRREDIVSKRPGAIYSITDPKVVWIAALTRPSRIAMNRKSPIFTQVSKFNDILQDVIRRKTESYYLELTKLTESLHFDCTGNLSKSGKIAFWRELNEMLKRFEKREITLRPEKPNY